MSISCDILEHRKIEGANSSYTDAQAEEYAAKVQVPPRPRETKEEIDENGAFIRQANAFITPFGDRPGDHRAEKGRYAIYWAKGCNWSNRPVIARDLLGLKDVIADRLVTHTGETNRYGHGFADQEGHKDPLTGAYFLSEFYKRADPECKGRATTPTIVDIIDKVAVNNDYHRMSNYIEVQFRPFQPVDAPDLYPKKYRKEIDELNDWLFPHINNGHYRMAFCQSIGAYEEAFDDFYDSMDKLEKRLETNRFLFGDYITDSDIRFFVTLARWDIWYYRNVGPVKHRIVDYPNIWGYARELYSLPAFKDNTYLRDIAAGPGSGSSGFFQDFNSRLASQIDFEALWKNDGKRAALSKTPEELFLRHPEGESPEEYIEAISTTIWNSPDPKDRVPENGTLSVDASENPLKGLL